MDTELILLELLTKDDIETTVMSPVLSIMIYICIIYSLFRLYEDDSVTNAFILAIGWFTFQSYKKEFNLIMKDLCY
jgi:hypothetical protein